jgi:hypothetical protein
VRRWNYGGAVCRMCGRCSADLRNGGLKGTRSRRDSNADRPMKTAGSMKTGQRAMGTHYFAPSLSSLRDGENSITPTVRSCRT